MKKIISVLLSIMLIMSITFQVMAISSVALKSISLDKSSITLKAGGTYSLKVTLEPSNTTQRLLSYSTSDENIAIVSANGNIKAIAAGAVTITVTSALNKSATAKCDLTVLPAAPTNISILTDFYTPTAPTDNNIVLKAIEKATNTKLNIIWVPASNYPDKLTLSLAAGVTPDLTLVTSPHDNLIRSYYSQGIFKDLTNEYKNYKTLAAMPTAAWTNQVAPNGKNYIIPRPRPVDGGSGVFTFRQDLFDSAGLTLPTNTDDLYNDLKILKKLHPDFTGFLCGADPTGRTPSQQLSHLFDCFTKTNEESGLFAYVNGRIIFTDLIPEMKDGLVYVKKLYDEKLINEDFAIVKDVGSLAYTGKWLSFREGTFANCWDRQKELMKIDPNAKVRGVATMNGLAHNAPGHFGGYGVCSRVSNDKFKKIMTFMDDMNNPDVAGDLAAFGIKDVDYKVVNGKNVAIADAAARDNVGNNTFGQIGMTYDKYLRAGTSTLDIPQDLVEYNKKLIDIQSKVSIGAPMDKGISSPTGDKLFMDYYKKSADIKLKVILGKVPMSDWDKYVDGLKADKTLAKSMDELTSSYNKKIGK